MAEDDPWTNKAFTANDQSANPEPTPTSSSYLKRIFVPRSNLIAKVPRGLLKTMQKNTSNSGVHRDIIDSSKGHKPHHRKNLSSRFRSILRDAILGRKESESPHACYLDERRSGSHENDGDLGQLTWKKESDPAEVAVESGRTSSESSNCENLTLADEISSLSLTLSLGESVAKQNDGKCDEANRNHENSLRFLPSLESKASSGMDKTNPSWSGVTRTSFSNEKIITMSRRTRRISSVQTQGSKNADADEENRLGQKQCEHKLEEGSNKEKNSHNPKSNKKRNKGKEDNGKNGSDAAGKELCKKRILIGKRCQPLTLSCTLHYDEEGVLIPEVLP